METRRDNHKTEMGNGTCRYKKLASKIQLNEVYKSVRPPEMRGKKSELRCLWIVLQAVEVKGRIKNRKRWRYLTEQAHTHTPVLVKLMSTAWKPSILLRDLSVKRFLLTFCAIIINVKRHFLSHVRTRSFLLSPNPSFSLAESMTTEKKKYHSLNQKACSTSLNRLFNIVL